MGIGMRELLIILVIALILFGAKKLRTVGTDLGAAVRGFKKAVNDGDDEQTKQLKDLGTGKDADFDTTAKPSANASTSSDQKSSA
jgi:sec-independent protein translocase protein TatA